MPVFDELTLSGTTNTQNETWIRRLDTLRTSATSAVTIATIAVATGTGLILEPMLVGRETSSNAVWIESAACIVYNNAGTLTLNLGLSTGVTTVWSNDISAFFFSFVISGTNLLIKITPHTANQTDWEMLTDYMVV